MRSKSTIALVVVIACIAGFFMVSGCIRIGTYYWSGWTSRQVIVAVFDGHSKIPVSGAVVTLVQEESEMGKEVNLEAMTGPDGVAELSVRFPAGGQKKLWGEQGNFGLCGTLKITAERYSTLTEPLSSLTGKETLPIRNKSAIQVRVNLTRRE